MYIAYTITAIFESRVMLLFKLNKTYVIINITELVIVGCVYLFDLILYIILTIFQLYRNGSPWVESVLS